MATKWSAGPGCACAGALRQAALWTEGLHAAHLLRGGLMLLATAHLALILSHVPDNAGTGPGLTIWMLASALTVVALAAITWHSDAHRPAPDRTEPRYDHPGPELLDLLARINHDLRTPLNAVIGFSDVMQREMFGPLGNARYQEYARHIRDSGDVLLKATEDTLAMTTLLAAPPRMGLRRVALTEILDAIRTELATDGSEAAVVVCGAKAAHVIADPDALLQAVRHVVRSAVCHAGGLMPVEVEAHVVEGRVSMTVLVGCAPLQGVRPAPNEELGLGRETLSLRLARALLGLQGMDLAHETSGTSWQARIDMKGDAVRATA